MLFVSSETILCNFIDGCYEQCFNLEIEMLFVSSFKEVMIHTIAVIAYPGFNLEIEMLFVSRLKSLLSASPSSALYWFQSRNRDAFRFKNMESS